MRFGDPKVPLQLRVMGAVLMGLGCIHVGIGLYLLAWR